MAASYKFYINNTEYSPINLGSITIRDTRERESGSYQYVKSLGSKVVFGNDDGAFDYINRHGECQEIVLTIREYCKEFPSGVDIFKGKFTKRGSSFDSDSSIVGINPVERSLYQCVLDNYDRDFNFLEAPTVVEATYALDVSKYEYIIYGGIQHTHAPYFGARILNTFGNSPINGVSVFGRETKTTYCQAGNPQSPSQGGGNAWEVLVNNCEAKKQTTWFRKPTIFTPISTAVNFDITGCAGAGCTPLPPPVTSDEVWVLMDTAAVGAPFGTLAFWIDQNSIPKNEKKIDNGRLLTEVINYGLNQYEDCKELDLQSNLLFNQTDTVTGVSPSPLYELQIHAIADVKDPDATEQATREDINIRDLMTSLIEGKFNAFWRVDEGTKRFIVEHINDLNNQGVIDLTQIDGGEWLKLKNKYEYDNTDIPKEESFPSLDESIDFTGVGIEYRNACSKGKKTYTTDKYYSEVESILEPESDYPKDGIVVITPNSLAPPGTLDVNNIPIGTRSENGFITGDYRPNAPQAMANLHENYWKYYRPFSSGIMNFIPQSFDKIRPNKKLESLSVPICCYFLFNPYSSFIGNNYTNGQLESSKYSLSTGFIELNLEY